MNDSQEKLNESGTSPRQEKFLFDCEHLINFCTSYEKSDTQDQSDSILETKIRDLDNRWLKLQNSYEALMISPSKGNSKDYKENARINFDACSEAYYACRSHILDLLKLSRACETQNTVARTSLLTHQITPSNRTSFIKLPQCDIDTFSGNYEDWPAFRDLFTTALIENDEIPKAQKLFYLRLKTKGSAGAIVKRYTLCDENFDHAWNALKFRFDNKRLLIDNKLKLLFNIPAAESENVESIQRIHSTVTDCLTALRALNVKVDGWDPIIIYLVSTKLPDETLQLWEQSFKTRRELPTWVQMDEFLMNRCEIVERISSIKTTKERFSLPNLPNPRIQTYASQEKLNPTCHLCNGDHSLRSCEKFRRYTVQQRIDYVFQNKVCNNCLSTSHTKSKCSSKKLCFVCKSDHHTLLHLQKPREIPQPTLNSEITKKPSTALNYRPNEPRVDRKNEFKDDVPSTSRKSNVQANFSANNEYILLRTALVQIELRGELFTLRALIDPGSQRTFLSERIRNLLNIPYRPAHVEIIGIGGQTQAANKECTITIFAKKKNLKFDVSAIILPKVTKQIPSISFTPPNSSQLQNLDLADPNFNSASQIDLILGNDSEHHINIEGIQKNVCGQATAYNTIFGWVLSGPVQSSTVQTFTTTVVSSQSASLNDILRKFWEQEELYSDPIISEEDKYCEEFYKRTTTRNKEGRYTVRLPFKKEFPESKFLGPSRVVAFVQNSRINQSLSKTPELELEYKKVLEEYIELDQMEPTSYREIVHDDKYFSFYLPHHAVLRPESKTTKVRVVFNASRKTKSGFSLNDVLHAGPMLQSDLMSVILNWRNYRYVFNGDIQKMYRQIWIHPDDRPFQRIIFQDSCSNRIRDFQLKTVTFGVNCAPFLAIRTLHQLADDSETQFPKAAKILRRETYVDDILSGGHTLAEAKESQSQLIQILKSAGFDLKKITANESQLIQDIPPEDLYDSEFLRLPESSSTKTLGIRWNALSDNFFYSFDPIAHTEIISKRIMLSGIASIFDPAGWIAPIVIRAKMLMQELWLQGLQWDDPVNSELLEKWKTLLADLSKIDKIKIPRWSQYSPEYKIQIHGFSDASKGAYCAAVYLRCQTSSQVVFSNLIAAKSKVAPIQPISLPRLELSGAVLLAKLVKYLTNTLKLPQCEIFLWTDSLIVIGWLSKPPWTWETYIANRTAQIYSSLPEANWSHVRTHDNPADLGTRGCRPEELADNLLWWQGPPWLVKPKSEWPKKPSTEIPEINKKVECLHSSAINNDILERFSSYPRALRVVSYIFRLLHNSLIKYRNLYHNTQIHLSHRELKFTKTRLIHLAQNTHYSTELKDISDSRPISGKSSLKALNPFLDSENILRVNGRLSYSSLPYNERHPIILPGTSRLCQLYLNYLHSYLAHADCNQMCRMVHTEFHISRLKIHIKRIIRRCKTCITYKQKPCSQIMAPLPPDRCTLTIPFQVTGIDYAGPFELKVSPLKKSTVVKAYVSVFVCFGTKAVHLEVCSDLSTAAFRAAFSRFVGRRGLPCRLYSDNGRNFVGANRQLKREFELFVKSTSADIAQKYNEQGFEWIFIPPHAPHMGGLWEAAVKSFKYHLKRVAGAYTFTYEEFSTILTRIEGILNSRPISALSEDPTDVTALTPGHFLRGAPIMSFPESHDQRIALVNRWEKLKAMHHQLSIRWKEDYLKALQKRYKWKDPHANLEVGDLVVIMDDLLPPAEWRLGRIMTVHFGDDGFVRVADIKTATGMVTRPIVKLCYLPFLRDDEVSNSNPN